MATVKYGSLELVPAPLVGVDIASRFFDADIRYSRSFIYTLRGSVLDYNQSGFSGVYTKTDDIVSGFADCYLPFEINGKVVGYPYVRSISFDGGSQVRRDNYSIELEILQSGFPFQFTGEYYGLTGISGLFYNVENVTESFNYESDFKTYNYSHNVEVQYRTGFNIEPLLAAKLIASGMLSSKAAFPFITTSGSGNKTYAERISEFDGTYGVTENFEGTTGNMPYEHYYSLALAYAENGITTVTQQGIVRGFGDAKYDNAKSGYNVIKPDIYPNCSGFYALYQSGTLNSTNLTDTRADNIQIGTIDYSRNFTDETGISDVRWTYQHQLTLDNETVNASENGTIQGLGHISNRFNQASGYYNFVSSGIAGRVLDFASGFGATGNYYNVSKEQGYNRYEGNVSYNWGFSNNLGLGAGSGIQSWEADISEDIPVHAKVAFNVVNIGVVLQSLGSTTQGQRNVSLRLQGFRDTPQTGLLAFAQDKFNTYRPTGLSYINPFIQNLSLDYNVVENTMNGGIGFGFGGYKIYRDIRV